ncbi:hypothetical protein QBC35DRAFT_381054 [Podospora australis]|uniref:Copper acquisition factor BIM1-like domain-containing protein n=1 Tax=Podospora australis TaxID=1536484 RepID=A0AAN6WXJ6_9PEZI|nr:hypothetical protein QBC35DRAFT_381054 [Podospora australis]
MVRLPPAVMAMAATVIGVQAASEVQGPMGFMWPPDRHWQESTDNTAPCGSNQGVVNRTDFPLTGGRVAFTAQDDSYHTELALSFKNDPKTQSDFDYILYNNPITEIDPGHTCFKIPDAPPGIPAGTNATIQIKYIADFDRPENQTFYACADIVYVPASAFDNDDVPCFNATDSENDVPAPTATGKPTGLPGHGDDGPPLNPSSVPPVSSGGSGSSGLSKGAIAGAVVGSIVGLAAIIGLAILFYRERQRKNRLIAQRDSGRGVKWVEDPAKPSTSAEDIRMGSVASK